MSQIEKELLEATGFKPKRTYKNHQDYLGALIRAVDQVDNDAFDDLSNGAAEWFNAGVRALNEKKEIPNFPDAVEAEIASEDEDEAADVNLTAAVEEVDDIEPEEKPVKTSKKPTRPKGQPPKKLDHPPIGVDITPENYETDAYDCVKGSKNAAAVAMLEKGCRMADITETIGGTYYNLLTRLVKKGHTLKKGANGMITLVHKDAPDADAPKKRKK